VGGGVHLGPLGTAATNRPIVPAPGDYDGEIGGMIGRGNRSTQRKPAPVPLCPPQTPHAARARTQAAAVASQRLTACATARPGTTLRLAPTLLTCLACVALPGAHAPASIALLVTGARKLPLYDNAAVLEEVFI
jgi:hypothetical protein